MFPLPIIYFPKEKKFIPTNTASKHGKISSKCQNFSQRLPGFARIRRPRTPPPEGSVRPGFARIRPDSPLANASPKSTKMADTATPLRPARASKQSGKDSAVTYSDSLHVVWGCRGGEGPRGAGCGGFPVVLRPFSRGLRTSSPPPC